MTQGLSNGSSLGRGYINSRSLKTSEQPMNHEKSRDDFLWEIGILRVLT